MRKTCFYFFVCFVSCTTRATARSMLYLQHNQILFPPFTLATHHMLILQIKHTPMFDLIQEQQATQRGSVPPPIILEGPHLWDITVVLLHPLDFTTWKKGGWPISDYIRRVLVRIWESISCGTCNTLLRLIYV